MKSRGAQNGPHFLIICSPILIAAKKFSIDILLDRMDNEFETIACKLSKEKAQIMDNKPNKLHNKK